MVVYLPRDQSEASHHVTAMADSKERAVRSRRKEITQGFLFRLSLLSSVFTFVKKIYPHIKMRLISDLHCRNQKTEERATEAIKNKKYHSRAQKI